VRRIRVVAALIERGNEVLVSRRRDRPNKPGLWEFPGGKIEPGETEHKALIRELREELAIDSTPGALYARVEHRYSELEVELSLYRTQIPLDAQPRALEAQEVRWVLRTTMPSLPFLEADVALVKRIASEPAP
jgi:8-oxo-dGTP diphosphatase